MALCNIRDRFEKATFIVPISSEDTQVRLRNVEGEIRHTITPSEVAVTYVQGNLIKIKTITDLHDVCFESHAEALEAILLLQDALDQVLDQSQVDIYLPLAGGTMSGEIEAEDITFKEVNASFGPILTYTRPDILAGDPLPASGVIVPGVVELNRGFSFNQWTGGGLFNSVSELEYFITSPADTEWNTKYTDAVLYGHSNPDDLKDRTYSDWRTSVNNSAGSFIIGLEMVMHIISTDQYFFITFNSWTSGGSGAGFSYTAHEVILEPRKRLTFSDTSYVDKAYKTFESLEDVPLYAGNGNLVPRVKGTEDGIEFVEISAAWKYPNAAFVDPLNGSDITGTVGDGNLPYRTISAAQSASNLIVGLPGNYSGIHTMATGKHYHFLPGVVFPSSSRLRDGGSTVDVIVTGHAVFGPFSYGLEFSGSNSKARITVEEFDNTRQFCFCLGSNQDVIVNVKRMETNNNNGAGYACTVRNGSSLTFNVDEYVHTRHWLAESRGAGIEKNKFTVNASVIKVLASSTYGNAFKALINDQGIATLGTIWTINCDNFYHEGTAQTSAFGVAESALLILVNTSATEVPEFNFKGKFDAGVMYGCLAYYNNRAGKINFSDGYLKSNSIALSVWHGANNSPSDITVTGRNFRFESPNFLQIGNGKKFYFENCTFFVSDLAETRIFNYKADNAGGGTPELYLYNCKAELGTPNSGTLLLDAGGAVTFGAVASQGTEPLDVAVTDIWSGYEHIPSFIAPKF